MSISDNLRNKIIDHACSGMFSDIMDNKIDFILVNDCVSVTGKKIFGPIGTVRIEAIDTKDENLSTGLQYLTNLEPGMILLVEGSENFAYFGEMMANLSLKYQISGAVILGRSRDVDSIMKLGFPLFHRGLTPKDIKGRGRVEAVDVPINFYGNFAKPGDWLFADSDGIVIFDASDCEYVSQEVSNLIDHERRIVEDIVSGMNGEQLAQKYDGF